jgi:NADPH:quinone reductase-like Zn-dependent oxidoreductase
VLSKERTVWPEVARLRDSPLSGSERRRPSRRAWCTTDVTIRLVGSDDLPEEAERRAVEDIEAALAAGVLRPRIARRLPLERIADAHEAIEGGQSGGRVILDID